MLVRCDTRSATDADSGSNGAAQAQPSRAIWVPLSRGHGTACVTAHERVLAPLVCPRGPVRMRPWSMCGHRV